jgi:hypothetical protein
MCMGETGSVRSPSLTAVQPTARSTWGDVGAYVESPVGVTDVTVDSSPC